ncbi:MAG: toprim domain-containing protein [Stellaceae bacterium]
MSDRALVVAAASEIAKALGGAHRSGAWWRCRCPVHGSQGATLALRDGDRGGLAIKCFGGCCSHEVYAQLRRLGLLTRVDRGEFIPPPDATLARRRAPAEAADRVRRIANALDLFRNDSRSAKGTLVERYLRSRGLALEIPATIRASLSWLRHSESGEMRPAMVALIEHILHGRTGVHLTYLALDGSQKATLQPDRRFLGPVGGGAVRLAPAAETLMVGEGIETCLAAMQATAMPAWAAVSTSGVKALVLPPIVRTIIILVDNDVNGAGEAAASLAGWRWLAEGRRVRLAKPPVPGTDFNDVIVGRTPERATGGLADVDHR